MYRVRLIGVFILILFPITLIFAQGRGNISGTVTDEATGEPLPGANVFIQGTSLGASTNLNGEYQIPGVPSGTYIVVVTYIGYKETKFDVRVTGEDIVRDVQLEYETVAGEAVEVTAQAEGQMAAINQQISAITIKNVVSAARIQDIPDVNAAESVSRLPGISLIRDGGEGQKVTVRGMSPKYNVMQVNGVRMQSTDRDDRSVDLNMIAPNILSGIEVTKALTADMDADAVGGTVNLKVGEAPEGFTGNVSLNDGYGSLGDTYGNYRASAFVSNRFLDSKLGVRLSGFLDNFDRSSDVLLASWDINRNVMEEGTDLLVSELASSTIRDRATDRKRQGGGLILDYRFSNGTLVFNNFISTLDEDQREVSNTLRNDGTFEAYGIINKVENTVFNNALQGEFEFFNIGVDFSLANSVSKQNRPGSLRMNVIAPNNSTGTLIPEGFDHRNATPAEFLNAVSVVDDLRAVRFFTTERDVTESAREALLNFSLPYNFTKYFSGNLKFGGKYVHNTRDNDETEHYVNPDRTEIGIEFVNLLIDSLWTDIGLTPDDNNLGIRHIHFADENYDVGDFLSGQEGVNRFFFLPNFERMRILEELARQNMVTTTRYGTTSAYTINEQPSRQYDYDYSRDLTAFYVQTDLNIGKHVTLYPGIRYEEYNVDYLAYYTERFGPNPNDFRSEEINVDSINVVKGDNWFPQLQMRIKPLDWLDVRLARTKSIIYPDYRAVSPYRYYNPQGSPTLDIANPFLKPAISQNFDVYTSVYNNHIGLLTAGYFYKEIDNLIVESRFVTRDPADINNLFPISTTQNTTIDTWVNLEEQSTVKGFELDWQTHFWYLPSYLKGLVLNINYTHITSETRYPFQTAVRSGGFPPRITFVDSSRTGRVPDQPNDILNVTLGYDIGGFSARLSFVYQDDVITQTDRTWEELDVYTDTFKRWDFTAYQKIPWFRGLQAYLNVNNITNNPDRRVVSTLRKLSRVEHYGFTTDLGLRYRF